jgi:hypothetical protein
MAITVEVKNVSSSMAKKAVWTVPTLQMININAAYGARPGSRCDKFGSLSTGPGC